MADRVDAAEIAILGGSATFRRGLQAVVQDAGFDVAAEPGDGTACTLVTLEVEGDVSVIAELQETESTWPIVALVPEPSAVVAALRAGAAAALPAASEPDAIVAAIQAARHGLAALPAHVMASMAKRVRSDLAALDAQEAEWLQFLASGQTVARLAEQVGYSEREMFRMLAELYQRLGASNRSEALVRAAQLGMLDV